MIVMKSNVSISDLGNPPYYKLICISRLRIFFRKGSLVVSWINKDQLTYRVLYDSRKDNG